jgi:hypothetical protein
MRIREGNDFTFNWAIERGGIAEDIQSAISRKLFLKRHGEAREITGYKIIGDGNIIHTEFTPDMLFGLGDYVLELHYVLSDTSLSDEDRRCAVDVDAFTIVARTAMAANVTEMVQTSDIALALRGKSAYELWLETHEGTEEDYFTWLREPSVTAAGYATEQGDYAKAQGNYAKAQGNYAKDQGDYVAGLQILSSIEYGETEYNEI